MKRVFLYMYFSHNLGDDLFLHIISKRYPNCKFTINYYNDDNDYDSFLKNYKNIETRVTLKNRILRRLKIRDYINNIDDIAHRNDALVFLAGSYFMEQNYGEYDYIYNTRKPVIDAFKQKRKKVYIIGSNFGPYLSQSFYDDWKQVFSICDDICFRDKHSYNLFKDMDNVRVANDVVLGLDVDKYKKNEKKKIAGFSIIDVRKKIGISQYHDSYIESTIKSIRMFIKKGYKCVLMSFCESEGDLDVINDIVNSLSKEESNEVEVYEYRDNLEEAINLISLFKVFVAGRFHANILGLLLNTCTIPIIYNEKTLNVLKDLKLSDIAVSMDDLNFICDEDYIEKRLKEGNKLNKDLYKYNKQFDELDKLLK